jgi:hypothetical protein
MKCEISVGPCVMHWMSRARPLTLIKAEAPGKHDWASESSPLPARASRNRSDGCWSDAGIAAIPAMSRAILMPMSPLNASSEPPRRSPCQMVLPRTFAEQLQVQRFDRGSMSPERSNRACALHLTARDPQLRHLRQEPLAPLAAQCSQVVRRIDPRCLAGMALHQVHRADKHAASGGSSFDHQLVAWLRPGLLQSIKGMVA